MTDAQKMLALASKSIPGSKWIYDEGNECVRRVADDGGMEEDFDPANNADQAWEVQAWLLSPALSMSSPDKGFFTITSWNVQRSKWIEEYELEPVVCWSVGHDGTAAGLRQAVTDAAVRVAAG